MNTDTLTPQERAVFSGLIQGRSNTEIALTMERGEKAVKSHVTSIFRKTGCKTRAQLIARYYMEKSP